VLPLSEVWRRTFRYGPAIVAAILWWSLYAPKVASADSASPAPAPTSSPDPTLASQLLELGGDFYLIDRQTVIHLLFRGSCQRGCASKSEFLYGRNLWNKHAQIRVQIPVITKFSQKKATYAGLGNIQLSYIYLVDDPRYTHFIQATLVPPTESYGVQGADTEFQAYYGSKWKWRTGSISAVSEVEQTFIAPPGQKWASFYDLKTALPDFAIAGHVHASIAYEAKVNFASYGVYESAGSAVHGGISRNVGLTLYNGWGFGATGQAPMWRYKMQIAASARL
jgi:hypothetical protein